MIYSMTGYATVTKEAPHGLLNLELRSVNHRYLDIQFRLPDKFRSLEPAMRELMSTRLNRGKVDCYLSFSQQLGTENMQQLNSDLLKRLLELNHTVKTALPDSHNLGVADILRWPGILKTDVLPTEDICNLCKELLQTALNEFTTARAREGEKLRVLLLERLTKMRRLAAKASLRIPALLTVFQEKITARLSDAMINCDDDRIRQEITLFASKIDVDEELSRLQTHLDEVEQILIKGGVVGKRLDFFMQELNREANTLGSKSVDAEVSKISIELKVLIEQMREQVQNIE
ncbi:MAG: YicC family protein [Betaproteobacteria bacterium]|nr:MAG: YicC family protein [Betaproteobacteria bacterium]TDI82152.1 MAG: YicC family protein [Betaproteobacteria bacterium]